MRNKIQICTFQNYAKELNGVLVQLLKMLFMIPGEAVVKGECFHSRESAEKEAQA